MGENGTLRRILSSSLQSLNTVIVCCEVGFRLGVRVWVLRLLFLFSLPVVHLPPISCSQKISHVLSGPQNAGRV